ncbi:hypothetical protein DMP23_20595 [Amycolatopsis sp. A1MSW2902]|uniref:phytanoyl-CoA dioxygenase family protein n=1 Tax=Amycolatopsis sp. A1MSW2902 TaxID=687413 RepID=UPI00307F8AB6
MIREPEGVPRFAPPYDVEALDDAVRTRGAAVLIGAFDPALCDRFVAEVHDYLDRHPDRREQAAKSILGSFQGPRSRTLHALVGRVPVATEMVAQPDLLGCARRLLAPLTASVLLTIAEYMKRHPGQECQSLHRDTEAWTHVPIGEHPVAVTLMCAMSDFTADNGATWVVLDSHRKPRGETPTMADAVRATMSTGDALLFRSDVFHAGGANDTVDDVRRIFSLGYQVGWLRPVENSTLRAARAGRRSAPGCPGAARLLRRAGARPVRGRPPEQRHDQKCAAGMTAERPAGLFEVVFLATHTELFGSTQSVMAAELDAPLPAATLVDGLRVLSRRQPMLRARLAGEPPDWRFVFDRTFDDVEVGTVSADTGWLAEIFAAECDNVLDLTRGPLWRVLLVDGGQGVVAVVVTFAHAIVDGVSAIAFIRQLVDSVAEAESHPVRPPLEDLVPVVPATAEPPPAPAPTGEWPFVEEVELTLRRTNVVLGRIEESTVDLMRRRCRAENVTVDALFVTATLRALRQRIPAALSVPVICAFDARPVLEPGVPAAEIGMYMKDLNLFDPEWAADRSSLWERASRIAGQIESRRNWELAHPAGYTAADIHTQIRLAAAYPMKSFPFGFSVSNLGRQSFVRGSRPSFRSLYLSSTDRIGIMGFQLVLTEMRGELFLTFVHADPLIAPDTMAALRDDIIATVRSAVHDDGGPA